MTRNRIQLPIKAITWTLLLSMVLLILAHVATQSIRYHLGLHEFYGLVRLFDMGTEGNLPTSFAAIQLLFAAVMLGLIGYSRRQAGDSYARHWLFLALILFLMAIDELAGIHELTVRPLRELAPSLVTGLFYWAWVIPAMILVLVVSWSYLGFVFRYLPSPTRNTTVVGATLFVSGAIGVEMPEARFVEQNGMDNFTYGMYVLVEEVLEMCGILVFLTGLLNYFRSHVGIVEMALTGSPAGAMVLETAPEAQSPAV